MATSSTPERIFVEALAGLPTRKELLMDSPRARCVESFAAELLTTLQKEDSTIRTKFYAFATQLWTMLESVLTSSAPSTMPKL